MPPINFGSYQTKIYHEGAALGRLPAVTTNPTLLEHHARKVLSPRAYSYVAGGAGEKATMDANRLAFRQWKFEFGERGKGN
ncbi:hypothetical protein Asppvi_002061 [Aspergillus pseudoviridinutans]|uniref:FMN-dependent dehydrogenase domain-containing protein n=1 Tax=Aspergillus pseudoviridinutans TaxID=1517512 RepID=A0A9P3EQY8_9EURO|nr:uncharacterized protein Asppvi_002061 [Aspergillus pseudoviridinutans]GIJ83242.1 hypothetical protein Asppvi_002061 [Aspergillus pseudoviridinutans]